MNFRIHEVHVDPKLLVDAALLLWLDLRDDVAFMLEIECTDAEDASRERRPYSFERKTLWLMGKLLAYARNRTDRIDGVGEGEAEEFIVERLFALEREHSA